MEGSIVEMKLEDEAVASIEEMLQQDVNDEIEQSSDIYISEKAPNIYRGKALNNFELYEMTAKHETQLILVAGLFHSGKTTMELAFYQLFLRGLNKNLQFAGSKTLVDVVERSEGLRIMSGNANPIVARTSKAIEDNYLHIAVVDSEHKRHDLVFTDFAGEVFEYGVSEDSPFLEKLVGLGHVIVLVDGEKLSGRMKDQALVDCKCVLMKLLQKNIISDRTIVHIVYSKYDMILESQNPNIEEIIKKNNEKICNMLGNRNILIHKIAAISCNTNKISNYEGLESLIESCLDEKNDEKEQNGHLKIIYADKSLAQSSFDKFAWKG